MRPRRSLHAFGSQKIGQQEELFADLLVEQSDSRK
jgi:hypothetical protein